MSTLATVGSITRIEMLRFLRERSNVFFVFVLPLVLIVFIGMQFGGMAGTPVGVVASGEPAATELVDRLRDLDGIAIVDVADEEELTQLVSRGTVSGGVVVQEGYQEALRAGAPFTIGFVGRPDATASYLRTIVEAEVADQAASSIAARAAADVLDRPADELTGLAAEVEAQMARVGVTSESVGGGIAEEFAGLGQFDLGASGQLFLFVFLTSLAGSAALIQTRQFGVASRMLSTPTPMLATIAGLGVGRFAVALFQALYIMVVTAVAFGVEWGDPLATGSLVVLFSLVSAATGMILGSVFRNDAQASGAGVGIALVLAALGGSMMPLDFFPEAIRPVALATPHGWANTAMAEILRRDGGFADIGTELAVLATLAVGLVTLATVLLKRAITR